MRRRFAVFFALAACAPREAEITVSEAGRAAPPPALVPTAQFDAALASATPDADRLQSVSADLAARAAALNARAAGMAAPVMAPAARDRLQTDVPGR